MRANWEQKYKIIRRNFQTSTNKAQRQLEQNIKDAITSLVGKTSKVRKSRAKGSRYYWQANYNWAEKRTREIAPQGRSNLALNSYRPESAAS